MDQKGLERGDREAKTGKGQSRNIRHLWPFTWKTYTNHFPFSNGILFPSRLEAVRKKFESVRTAYSPVR